MRLNFKIYIVSRNTMPLSIVTSQLLCNQNIGGNLDMDVTQTNIMAI